MNKVLLAAAAILVASAAIPASAHSAYGNGYNQYNNSSGYNGYNNGYGGSQYGNGYDRGYYDNRNREQVRVCLKHQLMHQKLAALGDRISDQGYFDGARHSDSRYYLEARHAKWHRDHPGADNCRY